MIRGANGILFWGYCWSQENHRPWGNRDPVETYFRAIGIHRPQEPFGPDTEAAYHAYSDQQSLVEETEPCEVIYHGCDESRLCGIGVKAATRIAHRGDPVEISAEALAVDPAWQGQVDEYCRKLGIDLAGKRAGWHLASKW